MSANEHQSARDAGASPSGRQRVMRGILAVVGALLLSIVTFRTDEFYDLESAARDIQARLRAPGLSSGIVLVTITERDYQDLFGGRSPLDAATVNRLLKAIAAGRPRAIGVDLESSHESFLPLRQMRTDVPVVWARDAVPCEAERADDVPDAGEHPAGAADVSPGHSCDGALTPLRVLGGDGSAPDVRSGLVTAKLDEKGTVRHYQRFMQTTEGLEPSFAEGVRRASTERTSGLETSLSPDEATRFHFIAFRPSSSADWRLTATQVIALASGAGFNGPDGVLRDKIVLLGGGYRAGRDEHHTPLGILPGLSIQAQTLDTELRGGGDPLPSLWWVGLAQFIVGSALVLTFYHFPPRRALLLVLVGAPVAVVLASLVTTGSIVAGLPYFLPLFVLVVVHQLYEKANLYREMLLEEVYARHRAGPNREEVLAGALERIEQRMGEGVGRAASYVARTRQRATNWWSARRERARAARTMIEDAPPTDESLPIERRSDDIES